MCDGGGMTMPVLSLVEDIIACLRVRKIPSDEFWVYIRGIKTLEEKYVIFFGEERAKKQ